MSKNKSPKGNKGMLYTGPKRGNQGAWWIVGGVVVAIAALFMWKALANPTPSASPGAGTTKKTTSPLIAQDNKLVSTQFLTSLTGLSSSLLKGVGQGSATNLPEHYPTAVPLTTGGKPEVLYIGADYCPYCAAERWGLILALSRFGTFSDLHYMTSSPSDTYPSTATFTFYGSTYTSSYISLVSVEQNGNTKVNGSYPKLQTPTAAELQLAAKYDPQGSIPFLDIGGRYVQVGSNYSPGLLKGYSWTQVIQQLNKPSTVLNQAVLGSANAITAAICASDKNQPTSVCSDPGLAAVRKAFSQG